MIKNPIKFCTLCGEKFTRSRPRCEARIPVSDMIQGQGFLYIQAAHQDCISSLDPLTLSRKKAKKES